MLIVAALAMLWAATSPSAKAAKTVTVETKDNNFSPATITVDAGDTITFNNIGQAPHTGTDKAGSFDTGNINPGESKSVTLDKAGTIALICKYHEALGMTGQITVRAAGSSSSTAAASPAARPSPSPTSAAIPTVKPLDPNAGVPILMKVFPLVTGGMFLLLILAIGVGYIRNVQKSTEPE